MPRLESQIVMQTILKFLAARSVPNLRLISPEWDEAIRKDWYSIELDLCSLDRSTYHCRELDPFKGWWNRTKSSLTSLKCLRELNITLCELISLMHVTEQTLEVVEVNCVARTATLEGVKSYADNDAVCPCSSLSVEESQTFSCSCWSPLPIFVPQLRKLKTLSWRLRDLTGTGRIQYVNPPLLPLRSLPSLKRIRLTWRAWLVLAQHDTDWLREDMAKEQQREVILSGSWDRQKVAFFRKAAQLAITDVHLTRIGDLRSLVDTACALGVLKSIGGLQPFRMHLDECKVGIPSDDWEYFHSISDSLSAKIFSLVTDEKFVYFEDYYDEAFLRMYGKPSEVWTDTLLPLVLSYASGKHDVAYSTHHCANWLETNWVIKGNCPKMPF